MPISNRIALKFSLQYLVSKSRGTESNQVFTQGHTANKILDFH